MKKEELDPATVPADASSIKYSLVKVIDKNMDNKLALDKIWTVKSINDKIVDIPKFEDKDNNLLLSLDTIEMKIFGYDGCNNFHGNFQLLHPNSITLQVIGATKVKCNNMQLPTSFITALKSTETFTLKDENLIFLDVNGYEVLKFVKAK